MSVLTKIFGDANQKYLENLRFLIEEINNFEKKFEGFSNEKLKEKTAEFKKRFKEGENLDNFLPEAFALTREAAKRTLSQRHFDVQLIGGIVLHQGKIAEMKTGEGKTLAATLPAYLNALTGKGVHIITVNDYLAERDAVWMGQIYDLLGISVGCITHEAAYLYDPAYQEENQNLKIKTQNENLKLENGGLDEERDLVGGFKVIKSFLRPVSRNEAYSADITYGTNNEFGFDYLRDNMVYDLKSQVQRGFYFAIVDEVDSILIDEARTPLIISGQAEESTEKYYLFAKLADRLKKNEDYTIDEKTKTAPPTESGQNKIVNWFGSDPWAENDITTTHQIESALKAKNFFIRDKNYVVENGQIVIVDEFTGRLMPGRRWSAGLHQAVEAKEHEIGGHPEVEVQKESKTFATITFQNYFRMYEKLSGMTGTALTSAEEFDKVYKLDVISVPTNKPMMRKNLSDRIYKTLEGKFKAVVKEIKEKHQKGQPVLVGTVSIEKNEYLGKLLEIEGVPHQILNAKQHEKEGEIIAQAGKSGMVTIATNMAGRGVDIILGGNPSDSVDAEKTREAGGLHVIGTERHEARRIDNQLRGRSGRQGDPGSSQFFVSLEDDLMRIFGGDKIKSLMEIMKVPEDQPIEANMISKAIESAQAKIEGFNFDLRKHILEYDDVMNKHREVFYKKRKEILEKSEKGNLKGQIIEIIKKTGHSEEKYEDKEKELGPENMRQVEKFVCLRTFDTLWMEHLEDMEHLRDSVRLRAYGQQDPLVEYKGEGHRMFRRLLDAIDSTVAEAIFQSEIRPGKSQTATPFRSAQESAGKPQEGAGKPQKVGRNDSCPCGKINPETGQPIKYKKCCYPKFG